jgi:hypothetical protein
MKQTMRVTLVVLLSTVLSALGCGPPPRPLPPPDGPGDCSTAAANLAKLGGCGLEPARIEQDCRDATGAEAEVGERFPVGCLTAAASCEAAQRCK